MLLKSIKKDSDEQGKLFSTELHEDLIRQVANFYFNREHLRSKAQKTRSEVSGGGKKPWRQKGTGRARAGSIRSPIWVGGGRAFAARSPKDQPKAAKKVNKKVFRKALSSLLTYYVEKNRVYEIDKIYY